MGNEFYKSDDNFYKNVCSEEGKHLRIFFGQTFSILPHSTADVLS